MKKTLIIKGIEPIDESTVNITYTDMTGKPKKQKAALCMLGEKYTNMTEDETFMILTFQNIEDENIEV